jgi:nucleoside 2-deoxyribosyltransferase
MKSLYFAAPLFNQAERSYNINLTQKIERIGINVFLPQRDGIEKLNGKSHEDKRTEMFLLDKSKIYESDIFLFVLDGRVPDEGACVELGLAYATRETKGSNSLILGLQTDIRAAFIGSRINPMIRQCLDGVFTDEDELLDYLKKPNPRLSIGNSSKYASNPENSILWVI